MTFDDIKNYFGSSYAFYKKTRMAHTNYIHWQRKGYVPYMTQKRIEEITKGALVADYKHGEGSKV
jgi:ABC-type long-subunit fatty acid transport system fused permease/ATPase subunit